MQPKNYGYDLSLYPESDEKLLEKGSKQTKTGIILFIASILFFIYGGFILTIVSLFLLPKKKKAQKIIAQRAYFEAIQAELDKIPKVNIIPDAKSKLKRQILSSMPLYDFSPIRKNLSYKKFFP